MRAWVIATSALLLACGGSEGRSAALLVELSEWQPADPDDDPFASEPDAMPGCNAIGGYGVEFFETELSFFVDTTLCDYVTVTQPAQVELREGDTVHLRLYQWPLTAPEPAEAHVALMFGSELAWEDRPTIPADAVMFDTTWTSETALQAGDPVRFHVHNHGDNNWSLLELRVVPP